MGKALYLCRQVEPIGSLLLANCALALLPSLVMLYLMTDERIILCQKIVLPHWKLLPPKSEFANSAAFTKGQPMAFPVLVTRTRRSCSSAKAPASTKIRKGYL